jgi:hypothetical protein
LSRGHAAVIVEAQHDTRQVRVVGFRTTELVIVLAGTERTVHEVLQDPAPPVVADDDEDLRAPMILARGHRGAHATRTIPPL